MSDMTWLTIEQAQALFHVEVDELVRAIDSGVIDTKLHELRDGRQVHLLLFHQLRKRYPAKTKKTITEADLRALTIGVGSAATFEVGMLVFEELIDSFVTNEKEEEADIPLDAHVSRLRVSLLLQFPEENNSTMEAFYTYLDQLEPLLVSANSGFVEVGINSRMINIYSDIDVTNFPHFCQLAVIDSHYFRDLEPIVVGTRFSINHSGLIVITSHFADTQWIGADMFENGKVVHKTVVAGGAELAAITWQVFRETSFFATKLSVLSS